MKVHVRHGAVFCRDALMLPARGGRWEIRSLGPAGGGDPDDPGDEDD